MTCAIFFQNCFGEFTTTYIDVIVPKADKLQYQIRKYHIATNLLGVCTVDLKFVYIFTSCKGLALNSRILWDAIIRHNGLKVPISMRNQLKNYIY